MFRKRHPHAGARPGTLVFGRDSAPSRIQVVRYSPEGIKDFPDATIDEIDAPIRDGESVWIDIAGIEQPDILDAVARRFELSGLTTEDIVNVPQRPKVELLDGKLLVISHVLDVDREGKLRVDQLSLLLGPNYVVSFHSEDERFLDPIRRRLQRQDSRLRLYGPDYLAYTVVDAVVDGYYPVLEVMGEELERLESRALNRPDPELLNSIHLLRTNLIQIRRSSWPMRDALEALVAGDTGLVTKQTISFLNDTRGHCAQVVDVVEMYRESAGALITTYMSSLAHRSNEIMKVLTMMTSVFVPLTFIAGIYGMNFKYMPELNYGWAYPAAWSVMLVTAATMLLLFYRWGWFGPSTLRAEMAENFTRDGVEAPKAQDQRVFVIKEPREVDDESRRTVVRSKSNAA